MTTPYTFDRRQEKAHPWEEGLRELEQSGDYNRKALAENIRRDHRVSEQREERLIGALNLQSRPDQVKREWELYFQQALCRPTEPDRYGKESAYRFGDNVRNKISRGVIKPDIQLLHLTSVNRMLKWIYVDDGSRTSRLTRAFKRWGISPPDLQRLRSPNLAEVREENDRLMTALKQAGREIICQFARELGASAGKTQPPWWACFANEMRRAKLKNQWPELCMALGLGHFRQYEWILCWEYSNKFVGDLYRPTTVEAGSSPYHVPSLPSCQTGIALNLGRGRSVLNEVVHRPLVGEELEKFCTGDLVQLEHFPSFEGQLEKLRQHHWQRLIDESHDPQDQYWLQRHQ